MSAANFVIEYDDTQITSPRVRGTSLQSLPTESVPSSFQHILDSYQQVAQSDESVGASSYWALPLQRGTHTGIDDPAPQLTSYLDPRRPNPGIHFRHPGGGVRAFAIDGVSPYSFDKSSNDSHSALRYFLQSWQRTQNSILAQYSPANASLPVPPPLSRPLAVVRSFAFLPEDWDEDGAQLFSPDTVFASSGFLYGMWTALPTRAKLNFAAPDVGPSSFGEIGFEWELPGKYLSVVVGDDKQIEVYWRNTTHGTGRVDESESTVLLSEAIRKAARIYEWMFAQ